MANLNEIKQKINIFFSKHNTKIHSLKNIGSALNNFAVSKNYLSLIEGSIGAVQSLIGSEIYYIDNFFAENYGWKKLQLNGNDDFFMFNNLFGNLEFEPCQIKDTTYTKKCGILKMMPNIGFAISNYGAIRIWFKPEFHSENEILNFLIKTESKRLNSKIFSLSYNRKFKTIGLVAEKLYDIKSIKSEYYTKILKEFIDDGHNRSILFYGPPGTGKTTLAETLIANFDMITLKFRYSPYIDLEDIRFIIEGFNVEIILMDDFDQINNTNELLEMLAYFNKQCKLVIAMANNLKDFHTALLRPRRFDKVILIDELEDEALKEILGDLYQDYSEKCKKWPIAFLQEFILCSKYSSSKEDLESVYDDLNKRVLSQLESLKK